MLTLISGAAPGVEQGAIEAAVNLALRWQGRASRHRWPHAAIYQTGLQPTSATDPGMVRRLNCQDADGALVFSTSMVLVGVPAFVDRVTEQMGRAFLHVTLNPLAFGGILTGIWPDAPVVDRSILPPEVIERVRAWLRDLPSGRVYVTGPSDEDVPGIQAAVRDALIAILEPFAVDEVRETTRAMGLITYESDRDPDGARALAENRLRDDPAIAALAKPLQPGEFLVSRDQNRAAFIRGIAAGPEHLPPTVTSPHAFDPPLATPVQDAVETEERPPHPGEFDHCDCPSHRDQDGNVTRRPQPSTPGDQTA